MWGNWTIWTYTVFAVRFSIMIMLYIIYCKGLFNILVKTNEIQPSNRYCFFKCTFNYILHIYFFIIIIFLNVCVKVVLKAFCNRWNWIVKNFSVLVKWLFLNPFEFSLQVFLVHSFGSLHLIIQDSGQNSGSCRRIHFHSRNLLLSSLDFLG